MVTVQTYRANQLPLTIDAAQGFWVEWLHTKRNKIKETWRVRKTNAPRIVSTNKIKWSGQPSLHTPHTHPPVISFLILWTRCEASFAPLLTAVSMVLFALLHYANWIGSIPAQIISSCQKDYHIIKGKTFLNFNQPGLITMYMQMLNFTSFFSAPDGPWSFSSRWNSLITHPWLWLPSLKTHWLINQHFFCISHLV